MRDQDQRALELGQRHGQRLSRVEVQVIGRFVQQQQVGLLPDDERQRQPGLLAAGEGRDRRGRHVAAEVEAAQEVAQFLLARVRRETRQLLQRRIVIAQGLQLVLREVADLQALAMTQRACQRRQCVGQRLDQRGFALPVGAEQADALATLDRQREAVQDRHRRIARIAAIDAVEHHHRIGRGVRLAELEGKASGGMHRREPFHLLQRLDPALRLTRLGGLGLEARDERFQMRDLLLLPRIGSLLQGHLLQPQRFEQAVVAAVAPQLLVLDMDRDGADRVEEFAVVRNHHERARVARQPVLQPHDGVQIQVVGRLVQQQQVGLAHQRLGQVQPHAPAAGERRHRLRGLRQREAKPEQQRLRARRCGVAVGVRKGGMRVGLGMAVAAGLRRRDAAFRVAQPHIAVDHIVQRAARHRRRFLRHVGHLPLRGHRYVATVRMQLTAQQREQRRLAAAVGADEADALAGVQRHAGVVEQHLGAALEN
ncbi:hypothetical protein L602_000600000890 [Cupriavidus gilardii J11]|uniref:Uncharacterized protein n=1 Tax=Cupriavidus gilardii J11 TaxID=936133 RepID=A0A562B3R3_9BURK|nr:hypothetical protein L602_000600000890 [Cupriavidus gilardii J11]